MDEFRTEKLKSERYDGKLITFTKHEDGIVVARFMGDDGDFYSLFAPSKKQAFGMIKQKIDRPESNIRLHHEEVLAFDKTSGRVSLDGEMSPDELVMGHYFLNWKGRGYNKKDMRRWAIEWYNHPDEYNVNVNEMRTLAWVINNPDKAWDLYVSKQ